MKPSEFLKQHEWCKGSYARDVDGNICNTGEECAHSFCAVGVLMVVFPDFEDRKIFCLELSKYLNYERVICWNDVPQRTKEDVIAVFEEVERRLELAISDSTKKV